MDFLPQAFSAFKNYKQFVVYKITPSASRAGKMDKIPIDPVLLYPVSAQDPENWLEDSIAIQFAKGLGAGYGVGFVFTEQDPFFFLDLDNCLLPDASSWNALSAEISAQLSGCAVEISSSGKGLHFFGRCSDLPHTCRNPDFGVELYTSGRFVALTGWGAQGDANIDCTVKLRDIITRYFTGAGTSEALSNWTTEPAAGWNGIQDDELLIKKALDSRSTSMFGASKASFAELWNADVDALQKAYPDADKGYNASSADAALAQHLAFWTGNNCERMQELMLKSALVRDKWQREDYLPRTILSACAKQKTFYNVPQASHIETEEGKVQISDGFMSLAGQKIHFKGCVYVCDDHRILIPGGQLLKPDQFKVIFGGFTFPLDPVNGKVTTDAYKAFTESQVLRHPRAATSTFRPDLMPGELIEKDGQLLVNIYSPVLTKRVKGDVTPFLKHLEKIFKDERDRVIIVSYMAAVVQYLGVKFKWCPILQGAEGNGKTFFTLCLAFAVGDKYSHFPRPQEIGGKFNEWVFGTCFIGVEDIYDGKRELMENLKTLLTATRYEIEPKGRAKTTKDVCCNFIMNTNHRDGLRKHRNDRRLAPFYTNQQNVEDLKEYGMDSDYFYNLYNWAYKQNGFAMINEYLHTYEIPDEFNPATHCQRAPITSSTDMAIRDGLGSIEQEIIEHVEQDKIGFKNGWISSIFLDQLLTNLRANVRIPLNKRRDIMRELGYDWHPGLIEGRVENFVMPDAGKPRLYIRNDHPYRQLLNKSDIVNAYTEAQK